MVFGKIRQVNITTEMRSSYLDYAMSVIVSRALPDTRDGLKPVQRRILYAMMREGLRHDQRFSKCAGIVGEVLKKYHPHGDSAVYDALVRLAQPWNMRYPLVDGQGNFGSIDGDSAAAYRYTEAKLTALAEELLNDIDRETVDFRPNFDGEHQEPTVLPALLPNLLLNGATGIAVGMATNIPPHNLRELCDGLAYLIDNSEATVDDLLKIIPGPDFPTGANILGTEGIVNAYSTGRGRIIMRAKTHIEEGNRGSFNIVVTELPYQVNKARLHERLAEMARDRKIEGIRDIQDQSDRKGMRLVIFLKQDAQPKKVLNALYKHSQMQTTFGANMVGLIERGSQPRVLTLKRMLIAYIEHRKEVIRRRSAFDLQKLRARGHILEGLCKALDHISSVIQMIQKAESAEFARNDLMSILQLSEIQAQAILDLQLRRLAALERQKIDAEYKEIGQNIAYLEGVLADSQKILALIKQDLLRVKEQYGDERRTRIVPDVDGEVSDEDLIPEQSVLITLTDRGYIKRQLADVYRTQRRGGRGIRSMGTREKDIVRHVLNCSTLDSLLFFTDRGKVYQLRAHEVPDASRMAKGLPLVNLVALDPNEHVTSVLSVPSFEQGKYLVMATVRGKVKRTLLREYSQVRSNGLIALSLNEGEEGEEGEEAKKGDVLGWVAISQGDEDILLTTAHGQTVRFKQAEMRPMGRTASGVRGIKLGQGDRVVGMGLATEGSHLLVITVKGQGKRTALSEYPVKGRATQGVISIRLREGKNDEVAAALVVNENSLLTFITENGTLMRTMADGISQYGRSTQGVIILNLVKNDRVAGLAYEELDSDEAKAARSQIDEDYNSLDVQDGTVDVEALEQPALLEVSDNEPDAEMA